MAKQVYWDLDTKESIVRGKSAAAIEREKYWQEKKSNGCDLCGEKGRLAFYHKDPSTFSFYPHYAKLTQSIEEIEDELKKCVCICLSCRNRLLGGKMSMPRVKNIPLWKELQVLWADQMRKYDIKPSKKEQKKLDAKKRVR